MKKNMIAWHGKKYYLLGTRNGEKYFLEEGRGYECGWYYSGGCVETFTNNNSPKLSRDISSHSHFDTMFLDGRESGFDAFKKFFDETPLTDCEIWRLCECFAGFYTARAYSDFIYRGGANYTKNTVCDLITDGADDEYHRINDKIIPALLDAIYKTLMPATEA